MRGIVLSGAQWLFSAGVDVPALPSHAMLATRTLARADLAAAYADPDVLPLDDFVDAFFASADAGNAAGAGGQAQEQGREVSGEEWEKRAGADALSHFPLLSTHSSPLATGRAGSLTQPLHDGAYRREPCKPACSIASRL